MCAKRGNLANCTGGSSSPITLPGERTSGEEEDEDDEDEEEEDDDEEGEEEDDEGEEEKDNDDDNNDADGDAERAMPETEDSGVIRTETASDRDPSPSSRETNAGADEQPQSSTEDASRRMNAQRIPAESRNMERRRSDSTNEAVTGIPSTAVAPISAVSTATAVHADQQREPAGEEPPQLQSARSSTTQGEANSSSASSSNPQSSQFLLSSLPQNLLLHIFSYLDDARDYCRLSRVSRRFRRIARSNYLWEPMYLRTWGAPASVRPRRHFKSSFRRRVEHLKRISSPSLHRHGVNPDARPSSFFGSSFGEFDEDGFSQLQEYCVFLALFALLVLFATLLPPLSFGGGLSGGPTATTRISPLLYAWPFATSVGHNGTLDLAPAFQVYRDPDGDYLLVGQRAWRSSSRGPLDAAIPLATETLSTTSSAPSTTPASTIANNIDSNTGRNMASNTAQGIATPNNVQQLLESGADEIEASKPLSGELHDERHSLMPSLSVDDDADYPAASHGRDCETAYFGHVEASHKFGTLRYRLLSPSLVLNATATLVSLPEPDAEWLDGAPLPLALQTRLFGCTPSRLDDQVSLPRLTESLGGGRVLYRVASPATHTLGFIWLHTREPWLTWFFSPTFWMVLTDANGDVIAQSDRRSLTASHFVFYEPRTKATTAAAGGGSPLAGTRARSTKPPALFTLTLNSMLPAYRSPSKATRAYGAGDQSPLSCNVQLLSKNLHKHTPATATLFHQLASFSATLLLETRRSG